MGRTRVDTIAKVLSSPPTQEETLLRAYTQTKMKRREHRGNVQDPDVFQAQRSQSETLKFQVKAARRFGNSEMHKAVLDQSPMGRAQASEDFLDVLMLGISITKTPVAIDRVPLFSRLMGILEVDAEPYVKNLAIATLTAEWREKKESHELVAKPLNAAIALRFANAPTDDARRIQVATFIDAHFSGESKEFREAIKLTSRPRKISSGKRLKKSQSSKSHVSLGK
jgi:hypothetical protein